MSSGSYLTLYRKYNKQIATKDEIDNVIKSYIEINKNHIYNENKSIDEIANDIPLILNPRINILDYTEDVSLIEDQRKQFHYILSTDNIYLDKLLSWHFNSSFTCLKKEFNLNNYIFKKSDYIIDRDTAKWIIQACNYLLSDTWSDKVENILNNKWISILANENNCVYLKYSYRNNIKQLCELTETDKECDNEFEYYLYQLKTVLEIFLYANDNNEYLCSTEILLVYSVY